MSAAVLHTTDRMSGRELRRRREAAGLNQAAIAREFGVATQTVSVWEMRGVPAQHVTAMRQLLEQAERAMRVVAWHCRLNNALVRCGQISRVEADRRIAEVERIERGRWT